MIYHSFALQRQQAAAAEVLPRIASNMMTLSRVFRHGFFERNLYYGGEIKLPSEKVLKEKQQAVDELAGRISDSEVGILIDYKGINVEQDTELRRALAGNEIEYNVVKNTLLKLAADKAGIDGLDGFLKGSTSLATSADPIAPFAVLKKFSKQFGEVFNVKAAFIKKDILTESQMADLSAHESIESLYSKTLGTMLAPISSLAYVLSQIAAQGGAPAAAAEAVTEASEAE